MDVTIERKRSKRPYLLGAAVIAVLALVTSGLSGLQDAAPTVSRSAVWIDTVERGELLREVSGPGRLVPEAVRVVSAHTDGTVERILVDPGGAVEPDTLIIELSNPELELKSLETAGDVKGAEADLLNARATMDIQAIEQRAAIESVRRQQREAQRQAEANRRLAEQNMVAPLTLAEVTERAEELTSRLEFEQEHARVLEAAAKARVAAQRAQLERLRAQQQLRERQLAALQVRAGAAGVVKELPLEVGEQVKMGMPLARVVDPTRLKAELRIPESRAQELVVGQRARIEIQGEEVMGRIKHVDPAVSAGSVTVDVALEGALPRGARLDLSVDGRIELERLGDVLHVGTPAVGSGAGTVSLFKLTADGRHAERVQVQLGGSSVQAVQVLQGLSEGDRVILSEMSEWDHAERIELR